MQIVHSEVHKRHATAGLTVQDLPYREVPARVEAILSACHTAGLGSEQAPTDHGLEAILAVHDADYVTYLQDVYAASGRAVPIVPTTFARGSTGQRPQAPELLAGYYAFDLWAPIVEGTWEAAYWSVQCALTAADLVLGGEAAAYGLCRPPGHHAAAALCGGYCYLNNAAIVARYLPDRIAILDIDYHHGNGTQTIFYTDPRVLVCSLHADPDHAYPYFWGSARERGEGEGAGLIRNWPLPLGISDQHYLAALDEALAAIRAFAPDFLVVSAGFDTAADDPEGEFRLSVDGMVAAGARVAGLGLPTVILQEGGYLLEVVGDYAVAFLRPFAQLTR